MVVAQALSGERPGPYLTTVAARAMLEKVPKDALQPIERALSESPGERFESCAAFADALQDEASVLRRARRKKLAAGAFASAALIRWCVALARRPRA